MPRIYIIPRGNSEGSLLFVSGRTQGEGRLDLPCHGVRETNKLGLLGDFSLLEVFPDRDVMCSVSRKNWI